jgi:hypothetical protein
MSMISYVSQNTVTFCTRNEMGWRTSFRSARKKIFLCFLLFSQFFLTSCVTHDWGRWKTLGLSDRFRLQNQTAYQANFIYFQRISLDSVPLIAAIAYLNENQGPETKRIRITPLTQLIADFSREPDEEMAAFMNTKVSIHGDQIRLDSAVSQVLKSAEKELITFYADGEIYVFPWKYFYVYGLYTSHYEDILPYPNYKPLPNGNMRFVDMLFFIEWKIKESIRDRMQIKWDQIDDARFKALLGMELRGPFGDSPSLYDLIAHIKSQLNLNCYLDDDGNLSLSEKEKK